MAFPDLSVVIPVYNEKTTLPDILEKVFAQEPAEIIVVDDGSTDRSREVLESQNGIRLLAHEKNIGKGAALRRAFREATKSIILIQDADLEYDPKEYEKLLAPIREGKAHVVYGSRLLLGHSEVRYPIYLLGNQVLSWWVSLLYGQRITDAYTCYKVFRRETLLEIHLSSEGFEIEAEITCKLLKRGIRILEIPISYRPRSLEEGKKIGWRDALMGFWTIFKLRFTG